jgi:predicted AAA+ superfamily ATPase
VITRPKYLNNIKAFINKPQVKVITGIRRSGKSTLLQLLKKELLQSGIDEEQIISINFESFVYAEYTTAKKLYAYVKQRIGGDQKNYLLLDEIQEVEEWEFL